MGRSTRSSRIRPHNKTSTGCWTCRARRVKCDEQTPACQRCIRYGVDCGGYTPRLSWANSRDHDQSKTTTTTTIISGSESSTPRRSRRFHLSPTSDAADLPSFSSDDVDGMLDRIDDCPPGSACSEAVFSVFSITPATVSSLDRAIQSHDSSTSSPARLPSPSPPTPAPAISTRLAVPPPNNYPSPAISTPWSAHDPQVHHELHPSPRQADTPHDTSSTASPRPTVTDPRAATHLSLLSVPSSQKRLIHHWVTFTSTKLVLLDEPHNAMRTLMLPMALRGIMSPSSTSTPDIATFHAICACAAYNLYELSSHADQDTRSLALHHDQLAIHHLRENLANADSHHDPSFAMAIMACITIEAISGATRRWRTHVQGGLAYLTRLRARGVVRSQVFEAFQAHMVSMAILCGCSADEDLKGFLYNPQGQSSELTFPYYGASSGFLRNQDRMNAFAASRRSSVAELVHNEELDALELQLYLDFPPMKPPGPGGPDPTHALMLHHMAQAFYYASLVFCQRCVRRSAVASVQTLVESGIKQLEAIETVSQGSAGSVMVWPALVLGAECATEGLQARMLSWLEGKRKLGFRNIVVLQDLLQMVWKARVEGDAQIGWQDLIDDENFDVFRV